MKEKTSNISQKINRSSYQYGSGKGGRRPKRENTPPPTLAVKSQFKKQIARIPEPDKGIIRIIPLGGCEEIVTSEKTTAAIHRTKLIPVLSIDRD